MSNCPFYGRAALGFGMGEPVLLDTNGNQCALVLDAHSPCYMEIQKDVPDWKRCMRVELARQAATLLEEHINQVTEEPIVPIIIGFPVEEWRRDLLRNFFEIKLPAIVPFSIQVNCSECKILVWIGPRQNAQRSAQGASVWCPSCMVVGISKLSTDQVTFATISLGNPDSKFED